MNKFTNKALVVILAASLAAAGCTTTGADGQQHASVGADAGIGAGFSF
jgi:hypothetical protein